ncbi:aldolase [Candidatus Woesearchaeota archaeon]|nr:aldolase [Candidatus Woesearchaeota archaeon]
MLKNKILVPADVPRRARRRYTNNYLAITKRSGRLMLFPGDQRIEHLNDDFDGKDIHPDDQNPIHFFNIASRAKIGAFAAQLGLISRYGMDFRNIDYIVKLNSKTNLVSVKQKESFSSVLTDVEQVYQFEKDSGLKVRGVGYTIYLGSEYEPQMLRTASQIVNKAHKRGYVVIFWIYPRGKAVKNEHEPHLLAGAAGVACCLGADFVKLNCPQRKGKCEPALLHKTVVAAGRTKVIVAGGEAKKPELFLKQVQQQLEVGASGNAIGRNVHQKRLDEAVRFANAIYALTVESKSLTEALNIYHGH